MGAMQVRPLSPTPEVSPWGRRVTPFVLVTTTTTTLFHLRFGGDFHVDVLVSIDSAFVSVVSDVSLRRQRKLECTVWRQHSRTVCRSCIFGFSRRCSRVACRYIEICVSLLFFKFTSSLLPIGSRQHAFVVSQQFLRGLAGLEQCNTSVQVQGDVKRSFQISK